VDEKVLNILSNNYFSIENEFDSNASELQDPKLGPSHSLPTLSCYSNETFLADISANIEVDSMIHMPVTNENNKNPDYSEEVIGKTSSASMVNDNTKKKFSDRKNKTNDKIKGGSRSNLSTFPQKNKVVEKKIEILNIMMKVEEENLKGRQIDNEIKNIIKERELIELKIKQRQYCELTGDKA
jgi:hypothetical protein